MGTVLIGRYQSLALGSWLSRLRTVNSTHHAMSRVPLAVAKCAMCSGSGKFDSGRHMPLTSGRHGGNIGAGFREGETVENDHEDAHRIEDLPTLRSQRRFLQIMSLISAIYYWFDVHINSETSFFGQSVHIGSTRYVLACLWIGLLWAAWRYGQQLYSAWRKLSKDLRGDFQLERSRLANRIVLRYLIRMPPSERLKFGNEKGKPHIRGIANVERFNFERARRFDTAGKEVAPEIPFGPLAKRSHSVILTRFDWLYEESGKQIDISFGIGRFRAALLVVRAAIAAGIRRPAVFDYITPALMWAFALLSLLLATTRGTVTGVCG